MARAANVTLVLINLLVFQLLYVAILYKKMGSTTTSLADYLYNPRNDVPFHHPIADNSLLERHLSNPLAIPPGSPPNLPSIRVEATDDNNTKENVDKHRKIYGGVGDKKHLGGFTELDLSGVSPNLWTKMMLTYGVRSFLDVGCGRGTSSKWFLEHGVDVLCVEGSHDAIMKSHLPSELIVEHDFSRGPWWPEKTYDAAWSVEFLEHVSRQYHYNYISTLRKAALIFVTSSQWGGWHHVEIHPDPWWIRKFELYGFKYDEELTMQSRKWASEDATNRTMLAPNGDVYKPTHLMRTLKVFVNPAVAALPQHQHLFPDHGCFLKYNAPDIEFRSETRPCGMPGRKGAELETPLPEWMLPLPVTPEMHQRWHDFIKERVPPKEA